MNEHVLVVGAGPVGILAAAELTRYGISTDLIEAKRASDTHSKALSVSAATLKTLKGIGIELEAHPLAARVQDIHLYYRGKRCAHINKGYIDSIFNFYLSIPQIETENYLETHLYKVSGHIDREKFLVNLEDHPDGVDTIIRDLATGAEEKRRYSAVVGCDGAQSTVRSLMGIDFSGEDYDAHLVMGDVFFHQKDAETRLSSYHIMENGFMIYLPMGRGLTRLVIGKNEPLPKKRPAPDLEELNAYIDYYYHRHLDIREVTWSSSVRFFSRLSTSIHAGNVFLAGDAFHLFSPIGGQGMNTGIQDAFNLGWKLAYSLQGLAKDSLLASYSDERFRAVRRVLEENRKNTNLVLGREKDPVIERMYRPSFAHRGLYRSDLALAFSGLSTDHSCDDHSLVGRHVPYCAGAGTASGESTYDLPQRKKNVVIVPEDIDVSHLNQLMKYNHVLDVLSGKDVGSDWLPRLQVNRRTSCLIRPDGYVGFHGDVESLPTFLKMLYYSSDELPKHICHLEREDRFAHSSHIQAFLSR